MLNPNVFYELGVRHALKPRVTVLIRRCGTRVPFNINNMDVQEYDERNCERSIQRISKYLLNGMLSDKADSPIHLFLKDLRIGIKEPPVDQRLIKEFAIKDVPEKLVGFIAGDIRHVHGIDIWVNGENTDMQMDRCTGQSIGAIIRYLGAKREGGVVRDDTIADALKRKLGNRHAVPPATVLETTSGQLLKSHGVKLLLHIATVQGTPGKGYKFIDTDIGSYVTNLLQACDRLSRGWFAPKYRSIVMPIFGTGNAGERSEVVFEQLLRAAIRSLRETPRHVIDRMYFLAFWETQVRLCDRVMTANPYLEAVVAPVSGQPILAKAG